eukprot:COSAG06_NODE_43324_length_373_cov_0.704380_2_plen_70_part_01
MVPVFIPLQQVTNWYEIFCLQVIWPVLHYMEVNINPGDHNQQQMMTSPACCCARDDPCATFVLVIKLGWP